MANFGERGTSLLPVLAEQTPIMMMCEFCPEPGHCCKGFDFGRATGDPYTFWKDSWQEDAERFLRRSHLPFKPVAISGEWTDDATGRAYVSLRFDCPKLGADGRCTIYADRPAACRRYAPGTTKICVMEGSELVRTLLGTQPPFEAEAQAHSVQTKEPNRLHAA